MNHSSNSASFPVFIDGTTSANSSAFEESTAPCDNLASIQRNWILVSPSSVQDATNQVSKPEVAPGSPSESV
jgi:hypothetical protein